VDGSLTFLPIVSVLFSDRVKLRSVSTGADQTATGVVLQFVISWSVLQSLQRRHLPVRIHVLCVCYRVCAKSRLFWVLEVSGCVVYRNDAL